MKVECIGGGPAGLYFGILAKKAFPEAEIRIYERNRPDDTFGWGVVFSDETLDNFQEADPESFEEIRRSFAYWSDIETFYGGTSVRSTGHGFCGLSRKRLLQIFHARCRELGVEIDFEREIGGLADVAADADLVLAADGINSVVRAQHEDVFRPHIGWGEARFCWLGTTKPLDAFTFVFEEDRHGLFQVHAYPFQRGEGRTLSTWIVECHEETWRAAGFEHATEEDTVAYFQDLFADYLDGHPLLTNRSLWRTFPTIHCETWRRGNVCLVGDAAHTAHFSIGSGTKLAMEDAIALVEAFRRHGTEDVPRVLEAYEDARWDEVLRLQRAARPSRTWFENCRRYTRQHPLQFKFNLMTRSKRVTYDNLKRRDPELIERVDTWFAEEAGCPAAEGQRAPAPVFTPLELRGLRLANRLVVSPMCQYSAVEGVVQDWHLVHLGSRAVGGAGLVFTEMTDVSPEGRITHGCAGMYDDAQEAAWKHVVDFVHSSSSAKIGMQLAHAGRKGSCNLPWEGDDPLRDGRGWHTLGPSALPFDEGWPAPREMDRADMDRVRDAFVASARRAERAGFDLLELHFAHGYLLSSFLSPAANHRTDAYGGSLANRMRYPLEVFEAVREVWPERKPLAVRVSATDWLPEGQGTTLEETVVLARELRSRGLDLIDVSSAGNTPASRPDYGRMYQVPLAERIRLEVDVPVMAVGAIQDVDQVNTVLAAGRADLCALARPHLVNPYLALGAVGKYEAYDADWPRQYLPAKPRPRQGGRRDVLL